MGKKSKQQRKSNKVPTCCYHGCTKKEFNNSRAYYKVIEAWVNNSNTDMVSEFIKKNIRVLVAPSFGRYVIAHITEDYLKGKGDVLLLKRLILLLQIRYMVIPNDEGKDVGPGSESFRNLKKYGRDIHTERGRINCMAREIPCDCMEEKRIAAKSMEKVAMCARCRNEFLKETMLRCKGCNCVQYCSKECSINDWPEHKELCRIIGSS